MSVHVTVAVDENGLVAVKRATTDAEVERLRAEAFRLRRAGHPGVVTLVSHDRVPGGEELRLRYAGDPLTRWRGSLAQVAGLAAAVAATLADLHGLGLVHGRVDAGHVLVGADGRPRLCGFSDPGQATPADDVLALGRLVATLVDTADEGRRSAFAFARRSAFAFARGGGVAAERRALGRLLTRALDPEPGRRPSARALSTGILAAVPGAALPPSSGEHPAVGDGLPPAAPAAAATEGADPALGGAVGPADVEPPAPPAPPEPVATAPGVRHDAAAADSDSDSDDGQGEEAWRIGTPGPRVDEEEADDSWTHVGAGADDDRAAGCRPSTDAVEPEPRNVPAEGARAPAAASRDGRDERDARPRLPTDPATNDAEAAAADEVGALDAWLAWSASAGLDRPLPRPAPRPGGGGPNAGTGPGRRATGPVPLPRLSDLPRRPPDSPTAAARDRRPPAVTPARSTQVSLRSRHAEGPGPGRPAATPAGSTPGPVPLPVAAVPGPGRRAAAPARSTQGPLPSPLAEVPGPGRPAPDRTPPPDGGADDADTLSWVPRRIREQVDGTAATRARRRGRAGAAAALAGLALAAGALVAGEGGGGPPPTHPGRAACPAPDAPATDVDGDGCPEPLAVEGNRVSAGDVTWEVGEPGDVVAVGDWDCDGSATSAVLRPATGDVFLFGGWSPDADPVTVTPARSVPGGVTLRVDPGDDGCDALVVEAADGASTVVSEARA